MEGWLVAEDKRLMVLSGGIQKVMTMWIAMMSMDPLFSRKRSMIMMNGCACTFVFAQDRFGLAQVHSRSLAR